MLHVLGRPPDYRNTVAVVGARKATAYGRRATFDLCRELARCGITVVSGMALGIDTAAHQGALAGGGNTVAVLGSGLGNIYPPQNHKLSRQIAETGCVISEFPINALPEAHHFPMRNRIISGMSLGTVVVEAARRSGSLITARLAAEQNREVFAVPGSIHAQTTQGTHDLIKQGAKLVDKVEDILIEIFPQLVDESRQASSPGATALPAAALTPEETTVLSLLGPYPVHIDSLARQQDMPIHQLTSTLSQLELKGVVCQEPGKYFMRLPGVKSE
jgi:DNA processing protein